MLARRLTAAIALAAIALGNVAAERRIRPVNVYLSTGAADGSCSPTTLTTRAVGQSDCGPIDPRGGSTTWQADATDDGFPFLAAPDQEADVTVVISSGFGVGEYEVTVEVELTGDITIAGSTTESFDAAAGDGTIEFSIPIEEGGWIDGGRVTVTAAGLGVQSYYVNGSGGSFIRIMPGTED